MGDVDGLVGKGVDGATSLIVLAAEFDGEVIFRFLGRVTCVASPAGYTDEEPFKVPDMTRPTASIAGNGKGPSFQSFGTTSSIASPAGNADEARS